MDHLDEDLLLRLTLGQLDDAAVAGATAHLQQCEACAKRRERLSSIVFAQTQTVGTAPVGVPTRPQGQGAAALTRGATLGRYVILELLGQGGMGEVFAAYDPHLDRKVALKLLRGNGLSAAEGRTRLLREAQAMARLQHPNVVAVHDVGVLDERVFVAMEFVEGETLTEWLRGGRPWEEVVRVFRQAGEGLAAAHRAGLVHRDFKPDNVLIGREGRARVLDFGLARQSSDTPSSRAAPEVVPDAFGEALDKPLTVEGAVMGTPGYMAPEQMAGLATDARSDQFSFCVALYEGLYGKRPFGGATLRQHAEAIAAGQVPPPPGDGAAPSWVYEVLKRGLAHQPDARWPDMGALLAALQPKRGRSLSRRLGLGALVAVAALSVGWGLSTQRQLQVCHGVEKQLNDVWNAQRRARLAASFGASGLPYAHEAWTLAARTLDAWVADWVATSRGACEAAQLRMTDTPQLYELKQACLDERRLRFEALLSLLESGDRQVIANAPGAARLLESPLGCGTRLDLERRALDEKAKVADDALRGAMHDAQALFAAGKYGEGLARLTPAAVVTGAPPQTRAEAWLLVGRLARRAGDTARARAANLTAAEEALRGSDATLEAQALSRLYVDDGGDDWQRLARAAAQRAGNDRALEAELASDDATVALSRHRYVDALAGYERALELQLARLGGEHPEVAQTFNNLGVVLTRLGRPDDAIAAYRRSLETHLAIEGPNHPNTAAAQHNLGVFLRSRGRYVEAREALEQALAVRRAALPRGHLDTLNTEQALVKVYTALRAVDEGRALLDELRAARVTQEGATSAAALQVKVMEADLYAAGDYWKESRAAADEAVAMARALGLDEAASGADALVAQGIAATGLGQWADAKQALQQAGAVRVKVAASVGDQAQVEEALGELALRQRRSAEAMAHFETARTMREGEPAPMPQAVGYDLSGIGRCLLGDGEAEAALEPLGRAKALYEKVDDARALAWVQALQAQATWLARPDERAAAQEALKAALVGVGPTERAELSSWLEAHHVALGP